MIAQLKDPSLLGHAADIAGEWIEAEGRKSLAVTDPATGETILHVPDLGVEETRFAIEVAEVSRKSWAARTTKQRSDLLRAWFNLMIENRDDLGVILTAEQGKPLAEAKGEITYGASFIEWFAEEA